MDTDIIKNLISKEHVSPSANQLYKKLNLYNITGINEYKNKNNNYHKENYYTPFNSKYNKTDVTPISNNEIFDYDEKDAKIIFIRNLIKKPSNKPYDGYACFRKKPTINYLIKKFDLKENSIGLEENKLCKIPYPLIKFISNRKTPDHSKELMTDILGAELNKLSTEQKNDIKYKNYKKPVRLASLRYPEISNNSNFFRKINYTSEIKKNRNRNNSQFPLLEKYIFNNYRYRNRNNINKSSENRDIYSCLTTSRPCYNNRRIKKSLMKSYCGEDTNLTEHSRVMNNISILKNDIAKKIDSKNDKFEKILKDISVLKSNNHIMAFES